MGCVYSHNRTPNSAVPDQLLGAPYCNSAKVPCTAGPCWSTLMIAARSRHLGGMNAGLADGWVRFVANAIDAGRDRLLSARRHGGALDGRRDRGRPLRRAPGERPTRGRNLPRGNHRRRPRAALRPERDANGIVLADSGSRPDPPAAVQYRQPTPRPQTPTAIARTFSSGKCVRDRHAPAVPSFDAHHRQVEATWQSRPEHIPRGRGFVGASRTSVR